MTLTRGTFMRHKLDGDFVTAVETNGYTFAITVDGAEVEIGVHKWASNRWTLTDIATGMGANGSHAFFARRGDAVEFAEGQLVRLMSEYMSDHRFDYMAKKAVFERIKGGEAMTSRMYRIEILETAARLREQHEDEAERAVEEVAAEVSLESVRAAIAEWENVVATQKNGRCLIWAWGELEPHKEELKAMGFKPSRTKGGWWARPTETGEERV